MSELATAACLPGLADVAIDPRFVAVSPDGCCWVIESGEWEHHFPTLAEAEQALGLSEDRRLEGTLYRRHAPCVAVACQCGAYRLGEDEHPPGLHFADWTEAIDYAVSIGINVTRTPNGGGHLVFDETETWNQRRRGAPNGGAGEHRWDCASLVNEGSSTSTP